MAYTVSFKSKWADFDANKHMRHSAYNDYAAECRIRFFNTHGLPPEFLEKHNFGPILFEENTRFYREIKMGESLSVEVRLSATSNKGERFKMVHHLYREDAILAAEIHVYIAWIDLSKRKLMAPPQEAIEMLQHLEKTEGFEEITLKKRS